jgi:Ca2+-binding RTX toxin-like protein
MSQNAIVSSLLTSQNAVTFREVEDNNVFRLASINNSIDFTGNARLEGRLESVDFFAFTVDRAVTLSVSELLKLNSNGMRVTLHRDFNDDGLDNGATENGRAVSDLLNGSPFVGADDFRADRLEPGQYFIGISKRPADRVVDYAIDMKAYEIDTSTVTLGFDRLFSAADATADIDVAIEANIDGTIVNTGFLSNNRSLLGTELVAEVDTDKRFIPITISAQLNSFRGVQTFDLNPLNGETALNLTYDTLTRQVFGPGFRTANENQFSLQRVNNADSGSVGGVLGLFVDYDTTPLLSNSLPRDVSVLKSNKADDETIVGNNKNGIIVVKRGNNTINAKAGDDIIHGGRDDDDITAGSGNDIAVGAKGNDTINGNAGDDILYGGDGNDTLKGGAGSDIFVLSRGKGVDTITDFERGQDRLGLLPGLAFERLQVSKKGKDALIRYGKETLAVVQDTKPNQLKIGDFIDVSFVSIEGVEVPVVI